MRDRVWCVITGIVIGCLLGSWCMWIAFHDEAIDSRLHEANMERENNYLSQQLASAEARCAELSDQIAELTTP